MLNRRIFTTFLLGLTIAHTARAVVFEYGGGNQQLMGQVLKAGEELQKGALDPALRDVNAVLASDPKFFPAYLIRAEIYLLQGKFQSAAQDCNAGLKIEPQLVDLAILRAEANRGMRNYAASLHELDHVIAIRPPRTSMMAMAYNARAWLRATCLDSAFRDGQKAIADAKRACSLTSSQKPDYLDTLAAAYAEAGDFDAAIKCEQQAMNAAGGAASYREHLTSFQQRRPIRGG